MAKTNWHTEHPGGGADAVVVLDQSRIDPAEAQDGANNPREPSDNFEEEHPGGED